ncbi:hypothetical protein L596_015928 [Steinernema carpocapsae]|uniref:G-protein coupled receptors family 1 profile domain-containing protein n=1 Tax=Steinernema carpocapsae TaxID=34508 RepID=A0A4U5NHE5_STECR|nr:hypothetical protein L596_015928 [Steinernema carpocapsae]
MILSWTYEYNIYMAFQMAFFNISIPGEVPTSIRTIIISITVCYLVIIALYCRKVGNSGPASRNNFFAIIAGVASVYIICWMIPKILAFVFNGKEFGELSQHMAVFGEYASAVLNFFVYGVAHKELRKRMKNVFCRKPIIVAPASAVTAY